jgi:hypothetical protein
MAINVLGRRPSIAGELVRLIDAEGGGRAALVCSGAECPQEAVGGVEGDA